jgi:hypothetical protein
MRLIRQESPGDWQSVMDRVCADVAPLARSKWEQTTNNA